MFVYLSECSVTKHFLIVVFYPLPQLRQRQRIPSDDLISELVLL